MGRRRRRQAKERETAPPKWAPVPRPRFGPWQQAGLVLRHGVPLAGALFSPTGAIDFLLLTLYGLGLSLSGLGVVALAISTKPTRERAGLADTVASFALMAGIGLAGALVYTALVGWVLALVASFTDDGLWHASLGWGALAMTVGVVPGLVAQYRDDVQSQRSEDERRRRDQPQVFEVMLASGFLFLLSGPIAGLGWGGMVVLALLLTAMLLFRDVRPDLVRKLVPERGPGNR
jgi:hypothetical protein